MVELIGMVVIGACLLTIAAFVIFQIGKALVKVLFDIPY